MWPIAELRARWRHRGDRLTCDQVVELVTDYLEGALEPDGEARFERHLRTCPDCVAYVEQSRAAAAAVGHVEPAPPEGATRDALLRAFREFNLEG